MPRIAIGTPEKARKVAPADGVAESLAWFDGQRDPIHLHVDTLAPGAEARLGPFAGDCAVYLWRGDARADGVALAEGSSLVIERGAAQALLAGPGGATLVRYMTNPEIQPPRAGGHVHLLPEPSVPRYAPGPGEQGASGGLHADGTCPTCSVWLHENTLPGMADEGAPEVAERGVHAHSEDEIIFITQGSMRLGNRLAGPGTALAIAADTFYSFTPGPEGLRFINFRPGHPEAFRMKNGGTFDEAGYWRERVSPPRYAGAGGSTPAPGASPA